MDCPKCGARMETKRYGPDISLQRCTECYGLLAEAEVLQAMKNEWMVENFLDIGHPGVGRQFDKIDDIECPVCHVPMEKVSDSKQTHIWVEICPQCDRVFLDAGEFSDLKHETLSDKFKRLLRRRR